MENKTTEQIVQEIQAQADACANARPSFPFWLLCKLIYLDIRGRKVKRVDLFPPYNIEFADSIS